MKRPPRIVSTRASRTQKAVQDTVAGCRELAAADVARASLMDTENGRRRLETSAQSWTNRAELIQRQDDSFETRRAIARSEWEEGESAPRRRYDPDERASS
jgi:hypothetical protein